MAGVFATSSLFLIGINGAVGITSLFDSSSLTGFAFFVPLSGLFLGAYLCITPAETFWRRFSKLLHDLVWRHKLEPAIERGLLGFGESGEA